MSIEPKRAGFYTLGCRVNQYETQAVREKLLSHGFVEAPFSEKCDLYFSTDAKTFELTAEIDS